MLYDQPVGVVDRYPLTAVHVEGRILDRDADVVVRHPRPDRLVGGAAEIDEVAPHVVDRHVPHDDVRRPADADAVPRLARRVRRVGQRQVVPLDRAVLDGDVVREPDPEQLEAVTAQRLHDRVTGPEDRVVGLEDAAAVEVEDDVRHPVVRERKSAARARRAGPEAVLHAVSGSGRELDHGRRRGRAGRDRARRQLAGEPEVQAQGHVDDAGRIEIVGTERERVVPLPRHDDDGRRRPHRDGVRGHRSGHEAREEDGHQREVLRPPRRCRRRQHGSEHQRHDRPTSSSDPALALYRPRGREAVERRGVTAVTASPIARPGLGRCIQCSHETCEGVTKRPRGGGRAQRRPKDRNCARWVRSLDQIETKDSQSTADTSTAIWLMSVRHRRAGVTVAVAVAARRGPKVGRTEDGCDGRESIPTSSRRRSRRARRRTTIRCAHSA